MNKKKKQGCFYHLEYLDYCPPLWYIHNLFSLLQVFLAEIKKFRQIKTRILKNSLNIKNHSQNYKLI